MENPFVIILDKLNTIESLLRVSKNNDPILSSPVSVIFNINQAADYLGLSKSTMYKMTSSRLIPHSKVSKRIYFIKIELDEWIAKHKIKTIEEIEQDAIKYLFRKKKY